MAPATATKRTRLELEPTVPGMATAGAQAHLDWDRLCFWWHRATETSRGLSLPLRGSQGVHITYGRLWYSTALEEGESVYSGGFREEQTVAYL